MTFMDDSKKKLHWWNRNYCFMATIIIIALILLLYALGIKKKVGNPEDYSWYNFMNLSNFFQNFVNNFFHLDWTHVITNAVTFFVCGLYIERKIGTFPTLFLTLLLAILSGVFTGSNNLSTNYAGFSGVVYAYYGYILVDYLFSLQKNKRTKQNVIFGVIVLAFNWFAMCLNVTTGTWFNIGDYNISIEWYPHSLLYNGGHYMAFIAGVIICLVLEIYAIFLRKTEKQ